MTYLTTQRLLTLDRQLTDRDRAITRTVAAWRLMSGDHLQRLFFADGGPSASRARVGRSALARLTELGLLRRLERVIGGVRGGSAGFVYEVAPAGERLLAYWNGEGLKRPRGTHEPGRRFVTHTLAVSDAAVRLREAERAGRADVLELEGEPAAWRHHVGPGGRRLTLKPDAYARLVVGDYEDSWFIEIDLATESSSAVRRQCEAYLGYYRSGREQAAREVFPRVLWVVPDRPRGELLQRVVAGLGGPAEELFVITTDSAMVETMVAAEVQA